MKEKQIKLTEFQIHQNGCKACQGVDVSHTTTLINVCLVGAPLLRDQLSAAATKRVLATRKALKIQFEDTRRTTSKKLKSVMQYVEMF